ncbi:site-specific DNA-methyltransferase [Hymenobacter rubripertinctus]|uniref:site-specific DNA-methyltransferase n=1 Tax=Hymenobacter rubripertinctus TaxID=2029981 RepID=UPI0021D080B0|nr:site-specific DNA-methyltransferase [Hymenobacter rubripertinctus]
MKTISLHHNNTLVYCKSGFQIKKLARTAEHNKAYSNPDNDPRGEWRSGDFRSPNYRENLRYDLATPSGKFIAPPEKGWRWEKSTLAKKIADKEVIFNFNETKITRKIYLEAQGGRVAESIWFGTEVGTTRDANRLLKELFDTEVPFNTPKPVELIERILQLATDKDSIVLDSFAGSGTTAHAVLRLNQQDGGQRKFILTEMEDYAEHITAERVKRVLRGYGGLPGTGGSFDYRTLGEPVFTESGELNEQAGLPGLRQYLYYTETRQPLPPGPPAAADNAAFLALHNDTAYYFHYAPDTVTTLNHDFLSTMRTRAGQYIIYADNCLLPAEFLTLHGIIFKKIPRDISRF